MARSIERSISGAEVAASAASRARPLPDATPTPSIAVPESRMIAFTSAKSTLTFCFLEGRAARMGKEGGEEMKEEKKLAG